MPVGLASFGQFISSFIAFNYEKTLQTFYVCFFVDKTADFVCARNFICELSGNFDMCAKMAKLIGQIPKRVQGKYKQLEIVFSKCSSGGE